MPYLWPLTLIETTRGIRKSHFSSGCRNGTTNPPLAASTCSGTSGPPPAATSSRVSAISATGSSSPVNVVPRMATTPIVFSSTASRTCSAVMTYRPRSMGRYFGSTSK